MKKPSILMVDDLKENLLALEMVLADLDVELVKATSGNEALALALDGDFALILLDVQMPEMDGYEVAALLQQSERTKHLPIIFVTAINKADMQVFRGYREGAVDYLFKPVVPEILKSKVSVFADLYKQRRVIQSQLQEIKTLRDILPICMHCQKIRNEAGDWDELTRYIQEHTDAQFSHGVCSECQQEHYPEIFEKNS